LLSRWPRLLDSTEYLDAIYAASANLLLTLAEDAFSYSERLLLIGHNPGVMNLLLGVLHQEQAAGIKTMGTGTLAVIEFPAGFSRQSGAGNLLHLKRQQDFSFD
jgi:phosphohistidine phosphatase SixA